MGLLTKKNRDPEVPARVQRMTDEDLFLWAEASLYGIGRNLSDWRAGRQAPSLDEVEMASVALLDVVRELKGRNSR